MGFDLVTLLNTELPKACKDFTLLGPGGERHGSWEWSFHKKSGGLNLFVFVALTSLPEPISGGPWYVVDFWAGADNEASFVRAPVGELRGAESHFTTGLPEPVISKLEKAAQLANRFTEADLTEAYLPSRRRS